MKKTLKTIFLSAGLLISLSGITQTVQEGINHLYAERIQSAKATFEKLLATNPNNIDATYWLGQIYLATDDIAGARSVYEKALTANGNVPLFLVGMGHVELLENKPSEARQHFETAISLSRGKKSDDPAVLNAIGRANVDAADNKFKTGDLNYGLEKLKMAGEKDPKNPDIFLNLGNAYRKLHDGGSAVTNYNKALTLNPNFAIASFRIAKIYETQKNWEPYLKDLNNAITKDPKFAPAYYELYYYNLGKLDFNAANDYGAKYIANTDQDIQNDYLVAQTEWARKNYDAAIAKAQDIINKAGTQAKPRTYKLIAYSYVGKGDSVSAKQYIDQYFAKAKQEEIVPQDLILKAEIYSGLPDNPNPDAIKEAYLQAANLDSVLQNKINLLQQGVDKFKAQGKKIAEAELRTALYNLKPNSKCAELFFIGLPYYQGGDFVKADSIFSVYATCLPDSIYGHFWSARSKSQLDTTMEKGLAIAPYMKTLDVATRDKVRYKSMGVEASGYIAGYYNNIKKMKDTAIAYLKRGLEFDPTNENIKNSINVLQQGSKPKSGTSKSGEPKPVANSNAKSTHVIQGTKR